MKPSCLISHCYCIFVRAPQGEVGQACCHCGHSIKTGVEPAGVERCPSGCVDGWLCVSTTATLGRCSADSRSRFSRVHALCHTCLDPFHAREETKTNFTPYWVGKQVFVHRLARPHNGLAKPQDTVCGSVVKTCYLIEDPSQVPPEEERCQDCFMTAVAGG